MTIIKDVPVKYVAAITGGGTAAIGNILKRGGASAWFLEGIVPYAKESLVDFLGTEPEKFVSEDTANQMALKSYLRAIKLGAKPSEAGGLGATAVLGKPSGEREGRKHFAHVSVQLAKSLSTYTILIDKFNGNRIDEEEFLSRKIDEILVDKSFLAPNRFMTDKYDYNHLLLSNTRDFVMFNTDNIPLLTNKTREVVFKKKWVVYSGSFNPFHDGHAEVIKQANINDVDGVLLELSIRNVDKPEVTLLSLYDRINSIHHGLRKHNLLSKVKGILITNTPKFKDKLWMLGPNVHFLVGSDTASRIVNEKYGNPHEVLDIAETYGTKFFVVNRPGYNFVVPKKYDTGHFVFTGSSGLDISSTAIRNQQA